MKKICRHLPCVLALCLLVVLCAGCSKSAKAKRLLASADRDFQAQQYDAAELEYRGVIRLTGLNPAAIRQLGLLYCIEGRPVQAVPFLNKSYQLNPADTEVELNIAETMLSLGQAKYAYRMASQVLDKEPTNETALLLCVDIARSATNLNIVRQRIEKLHPATDASGIHVALAWIDLRLNQTDAADAEIQKALQLDSKDPSVYLARSALESVRKDRQVAANDLKTASDLSPLRSNTRIKYADFQFQSGQTNEAVHFLEDLAHQTPDYIPAWIGLMRLYYSERNYDKCSEVISRILTRDAVNYDALLQSATIAMNRRDATNAISAFRLMDSVYTNKAEIKTRLAMAYLLNGEKGNAIANLTQALNIDTNYTPATLLLAEEDLRAGNSASAISLLAPIVKKDPGDIKARLILATAYLAQRQPEDALNVYRQLAQAFPKNPDVPRLIGEVYQQEGDDAKARDSFEQSLALAPDYIPTLELITRLDTAGKRYDEADKRLADVISRNPDKAELWLLRGDVYAAAGQTNQAESAMSKAIELDANLPGPYLSLATLYLDTHQEQQALDRLNALVAKTNNAMALLEIGQIHQQDKQFDQARDAYEKAIVVDPGFAPALNNLAYIYSEHYGNIEKASQMAERARQARPDDPHVADTLGWILFQQGQFTRALSLLQESLDKMPADPEVQMHLGMTYYMMEDEDLARVRLKQALASNADFPGKDEARLCLSLLAIDPSAATSADIALLEKRQHDKPGDPVPLNRLAAIDEMHGQTDKAAGAYEKLIAQNPQDWKAMIKLGRLYSGPLHQTRKALDLAKTAHDLAPNDPRATAMLGELVYASGDYEWALSLLEDSAPKLPDQPTVQYDLALAYYAAGRLPQADAAMAAAVSAGAALPTLDQGKQFQALRAAANDSTANTFSAAQVQSMLAKDEHYLPALALSGALAERQGDVAQATKVYEQILSEYPHFTPAMRQLVFIYSRRSGDEGKAYELGEKVWTLTPDDLELSRTLGILAYKKGDYPRSVQLLRDSAQKFDKDGELLYYLGMDYYQLKQPKESKANLQQAISLNVPSPLAAEANRVLAELK